MWGQLLFTDPMPDSESVFACQACRASLRLLRLDNQFRSWNGWLICDSCRTAVPIFDGFAHFVDAVPSSDDLSQERLRDLEHRVIGPPEKYERFIEIASRRPSFDLYAAFQPFNEATRAFYPLVDVLRENIKPGDVIVDVWNRTGWGGALLAGLFPEQKVISLWEGPTNVLGYAGYHRWFVSEQRPGNLTIAFADPRKGLPFADGSVAFVHGLDCLHRLGCTDFLREGERVLTRKGAMVFPHVHLSNSQPDPFFERGGTIVHGRDYTNWTPASGTRRPFVFCERSLFEIERPPVADNASMPHYNALVAVLPVEWQDRKLGGRTLSPDDESYLAINPLIAVNHDTGEARFDREGLGDSAEHLVIRHPVYAERLAQCLPVVLSQDQLRVLYWADFSASVGEIRKRSGLGETRFATALQGLIEHEIVAAAPIGQAMARLQQFFATRKDVTALAEQNFSTLWRRAGARYGERPLLVGEDGSTLSFAEAEDVVAAMAKLFGEKGVGPGRPVALWAVPSIEAILAVWAAWLLGAVVAPLDPTLPAAKVDELLVRLDPSLLLCDASKAGAVKIAITQLAFYEEGGSVPRNTAFLADALQAHMGAIIPECVLTDETPAAVLFTSGSTGTPKGVQLTQGALHRGSQSLVRGFGWEAGDVLLSLGSLHVMSGLRNPCVAALLAGATVAVPEFSHASHPSAIAAACQAFDATILAAAPAFLGATVSASTRERLRFGRLRQVIVTGATLGRALESRAEEKIGVPVLVYYGLTETAGVCSLVPPGEKRSDDGDIGKPAGALARIVTDDGANVAPEETGSLEIYSGNLTTGYLGDPVRSGALFDDGWLRTGDLARRDEGGHIILLGRRDDQIKNRFGEIVHPGVIEAILARRKDVADCTVIPTGPRSTVRLAAFVVPREGGGNDWLAAIEQSLLAELGNRFMPDYVIEIAVLPRHSNGKVSREPLRALVPAPN